MDVIIVGVPPLNDPTASKDAQDRINAWLRAYSAEMRLPFVDVYTPLVNPATRDFAEGMTMDGVHLTAAASVIAGQAIADVISRSYAPVSGLVAATAIDPTNILTNALALTDATADGIPDGWATLGTPTGGSVVHTLETVAGFPGKVIAVEQVGNINTRQLYQPINISTGKFAVGDLMQVSAMMDIPAAVNATLRVYLTGSSTGRTQVTFMAPWAASGWMTSVCQFRVPTGCTSLDFFFIISPGTGKARLARPTLTNLTRLGVTSGIE